MAVPLPPTTPNPPTPGSPPWGSTTKMVVGLTIVAVIAALMIQFRNLIGPLILAFMLAYLLQPVAERLCTVTRLSWRMVVNLIYLLLIVLLAGSFTLTGLAVVQQIQSLVGIVQNFVTDLPKLVANLSTQVYTFGPFAFDFSKLNLQTLTEQALGIIQPLLGRVGGLLSTFATSAAVTLGWAAFVLLISYFLLADAGRFPGSLLEIDVPGYNTDIRRLAIELKNIWNAFLRGQMIITLLIVIFYTLLMAGLGVRYSLAIALLAGLAKFVPYFGPLVVWIVVALVTFFQGGNYFGLQPYQYSILVIVLALILDQVFDNLVSPRLLGSSLGVHPAAVLVAALVATNLIGLIGLVLAAPVLATLQLLGRYVVRKMFDLDPWPSSSRLVVPADLHWLRRMRVWARRVQERRTWPWQKS